MVGNYESSYHHPSLQLLLYFAFFYSFYRVSHSFIISFSITYPGFLPAALFQNISFLKRLS